MRFDNLIRCGSRVIPLLGGVMIASLSFAPSALASPPDIIRLTGIVRDFQRTDATFAAVPSAGYGHYAGNVGLALDADRRPVFTGGGFKVVNQWRDPSSRPIAPHLATDSMNLPNILTVTMGINQGLQAVVDSFDPYVGPYDPLSAGPAPLVLPLVNPPNIWPVLNPEPLVDEAVYSSGGSETLTTDLHVNRFVIDSDTDLTVDGNLVIVCEEELLIEGGATLGLGPCATLTIYIMQDATATIRDDSFVNMDTSDPARLTILYLGNTDFTIESNSHVYANMISPAGELSIEDNAHYYGSYTGWGISVAMNMLAEAGFHYGPPPPFACCSRISDTSGSAGSTCDGGIGTQLEFSQWFRDVMDRNLSTRHSIDLIRSFDGVYEYLDDDFHPIDGLVFGNEGQSNNNYFTYAIEAQFVYDSCVGHYLEFMGSDDAWLFVNGELAMDVGGMLPGTEQFVDMDRLNLQDGKTYTLNFFYTQRQELFSVFRLRTTLELYTNVPTHIVSSAFD